jgi:hypothetical protein
MGIRHSFCGRRSRPTGGLRRLAAALVVGLVLAAPAKAQPEAPAGLAAHAGEREVVVRWEPVAGATAYRLYRSGSTETSVLLAETARAVHVDRAVSTGSHYAYAVVAVGHGGEGTRSAEVEAAPGPLTDEAFLLLVQRLAFDYFWHEAHPATGLVPDRTASGSASSIAAVGFGLTAYIIGVERGYVEREAASERTLRTLRTLWEAPQGPEARGTAGYRGMFYHFLEMGTGLRAGSSEVSTIDTALLMAGVLDAGAFFDGSHPDEQAIRTLSQQLYERVDWRWAQVRPPLIGHGWTPEAGHIPYDYGGYSEAMLLYLLALGSPTHPVEPASWDGFTEGYRWGAFYGYEHVNFGPLFGHQYTHAWVDFRGIQDAYMRGRGIDYFENSRRAALAQRTYAADNPMGWRGYDADIWGLTACDGPADTTLAVNGTMREFRSYWARGAALDGIHDDGTIAPTAAGGSVAFVPEEATYALKAMHARYGAALWGEYGFLDAFNPTFDFEDVPLRHGRVIPGLGWFDTDYLGIDQGPIVVMIENLRSGLIWRLMRADPYVRQGLRRAGFSGGWLDETSVP